ncbi:sensor histidine kinase [Actinopolymorpha pittospori]|uniref:histidine kinase n=1 Tax=Actinopolymorpha pittospori TaxID=648752 RepID=A0A927RGH6_9ACTN|nr:sensor histidine kinase [Actinopolymorpha pittospori]MBE1604231.1 signal transduction histidine kinase [Actinopolymorpha pittospori]
MYERAAALWDRLRRPAFQDAGLAVALLASTLAVYDAGVVLRKVNGLGSDGPWPVQLWIWWLATGMCVAAVLVRRRWPVPALIAATVAAIAQMALMTGPVPADLAAPLVLYIIAARFRRATSLALLGITVLVAAGWSLYVGLDGRPDGWAYHSPLEGQHKTEVRPEPAEPPEPGAAVKVPMDVLPPDPLAPSPSLIAKKEGTETLGPTSWGGIPLLGPLLVVGWAMGSGVQSRRAYLDELTARARDLERERDQQAALAAAAERSRITRELHDVVAHGLSVIVMQAQGGAAALDKRPTDTLAALATIVETGRASLADMRQVLAAVGAVDGSPHPVPGLNRLPHLIDQVRQAGTQVQLHIDGPPGVLPTTVDLAAYRIVQEALTNTMKHAGPGACAQVTLTYGSNDLRLKISDNGATAAEPDGIGSGLRGMRERAELLGGKLFAGPGPHGGFVVQARLPFVERAVE